MIQNIKQVFNILSITVMGGFLLYSCEPDADKLGEQFFIDGEAKGDTISRDVLAYNINNHDTIRTDASRLDSAVIGAFHEDVFGGQKANFFTQFKLAEDNPKFGTNAVVDSVVLVLKPSFIASTENSNTTTIPNYTTVDGSIAVKNLYKSYSVKKYGDDLPMTISVHEVADFMEGYSDKAFSDKSIGVGNLLGTKTFNGKVSSVEITKESDNSEVFKSVAGIRISLDKNVFQQKVVDKEGDSELQNVANFVRYFKGLRISVNENDGYLVKFQPNAMELKMYYKYDKTDNGTTTRPQAVHVFNIGAGNTRLGQYIYDRAGSQVQAVVNNNNTNDQRIYLQGMGGPSLGIKFPDATISDLRNKYLTDKAAIISAKIRVYTDNSWNTYKKPQLFNVFTREKSVNQQDLDKYTFTDDLTKLSSVLGFSLYNVHNIDENPTYYDFTVTETIKNIVEKEVDYSKKDLVINVGDFGRLYNSNGNSTLLGYYNSSRAVALSRVVLVGSDSSHPNKIQLKITYGTKSN